MHRFVSLFIVLLAGCQCLFAQTRPDSITADSVIRVRARLVEERVLRVDSGGVVREQRSRIRYRTFSDSTRRTGTDSGSREVLEREVVLKPDPNAAPDPTDRLRQERQEWKDRITLQLADLDEEIRMLENARPAGGRLAQLRRYRQRLDGYLPRVDAAATAAELQAEGGRIRPVLAEVKRYLERGGR
jgi:hypothetical protein